jgi:hypothetical protein
VGHFLPGFLAQLLADLGQDRAFAVAQPEASLELVAEYLIFCHEIFVPQQQFLIDGPSKVCQQYLPVHTPFTPHLCCL